METIQYGSSGEDVKTWQTFLLGSQFYSGEISGEFDLDTVEATKTYQKVKRTTVDGIVGPATWKLAENDGLGTNSDFPEKPTTIQPIRSDEKDSIFGQMNYASAPMPGNPENIKITNDWTSKYIVKVTIPQLKNVSGMAGGTTVLWHKNYSDNLVQLFKDWDDAGLMPLVLTWAGSWAPRFIRGSKSILSNHATASAFDINVQWNMLGRKPTPQGNRGSIIELIPAAVENGFWNGGWFERQDGMHFEIAKKVE